MGSPLAFSPGVQTSAGVPTCSALREGGLPLPACPKTEQSRGCVKSTLLQVVLWELIPVLVLISSFSLPPRCCALLADAVCRVVGD